MVNRQVACSLRQLPVAMGQIHQIIMLVREHQRMVAQHQEQMVFFISVKEHV